MYLSRFGVKRYKCLGDIDIPLTPIHVLIGENDSGKTSLLEAMAAFYASSEKPLSEVFPGPWTGRELLLHGSTEPNVEFAGEWTPLRNGHGRDRNPHLTYRFSVEFPVDGKGCISHREQIQSEGNLRSPPPRDDATQHETRVHLAKRAGRGRLNISDAEWDSITGVLKPAHKYALDAKVMAVPASLDPTRKFRLDPDGFGVATLLDDILGFDAQAFLQLRREFCDYFPQFKSVRVESEQGLQRRFDTPGLMHTASGIGKGIYFETHRGQTIRAQQASDGAILFLGLLALAHLPTPPTLLLIEEPENGIYPKRLGEVIKLLKQMVHRTEGVRFPQIIMSTHSPYVLSFFEPQEVTFLSREPGRPDASVRARPLRDAPNIKQRLADGEFYLGEVWYNLSEEELFGGA